VVAEPVVATRFEHQVTVLRDDDAVDVGRPARGALLDQSAQLRSVDEVTAEPRDDGPARQVLRGEQPAPGDG